MANTTAQPIEAEAAQEPGPGDETSFQPAPIIEVRIPAAAEWVRVVRLAVAGVASRLAFSHDDIEDIKLAVTEACNNAILHAATAAADSRAQPVMVIVQLALHEDRLEVAVIDEGHFAEGGLPQTAMRLVSPHENAPDDLSESGLGLFLMQSLMDSVEYSAGPQRTTTVRMVKYVEPSGME